MTVRADNWCCGLGILYLYGTFGMDLDERYSPTGIANQFYQEFWVPEDHTIRLRYYYSVYMFSDEYARPEKNKGSLVAKFILDNKLGTVTQTIGPGVHGYNISVWVWVMDKPAMLKWLQAEHEKRKPVIPKATETSVSSGGSSNFTIDAVSVFAHTHTIGEPPPDTVMTFTPSPEAQNRFKNAREFIQQKNTEYFRTLRKNPK